MARRIAASGPRTGAGGIGPIRPRSALADRGEIPRTRVADAMEKYGIDPEKPNPRMA